MDTLLTRFDAEDATGAASSAAEAPSRLKACSAARQHEALEGDVMEFRVLMQSAAQAAAKLPVLDATGSEGARARAARDDAARGCEALLGALLDLRDAAANRAAKKRDLSDVDAVWEDIDADFGAKRPRWEAAAETWRRRTHLGAAQAKMNLKAANLGPFEQARNALRDVARARRKMHPKRPTPDARAAASDDDLLDLEAYDDAALYKSQLRDFLDKRPAKRALAPKSAANDVYDDARAQLGAARGAAKDAKATNKKERTTKGRMLRFQTHEKLQNFMFPVPGPTPNVDVDMLFASLFR